MNASNCQLLKMNCIKRFSRTLSKFYTIRYDFFEFSEYLPIRKHPLMAAFIRFRSTYLSEHLKVDTLFIEQLSYFLLRIVLFKESPKKHTHSFSLLWGKGIQSLFFHHVFVITFTPSLFKSFSLMAKHKGFDFFKATHSMLNIIYIKLIYIKSSFGCTFE